MIIVMEKLIHFKKILLFCVGLLCCISGLRAQNSIESQKPVLDVQKERPVIQNLINLYSKYLLEGDSISIAAMYASDGMMGCKKGPEILSSAGSWIRSGIKNDSRHVTFKTVTLTADEGLLVETGKAEGRSDKGELKYSFRYLVVWKKEEGTWKMYRDIGI
jgi:ketosteroid isomerase-like protein